MEAGSLLRVVTLRRGKLRAVEFRLREGEKGLSLFAWSPNLLPTALVGAVREAGKQGELGVAVLSADELRRLGLKVLATPGGTPVAVVNALHREARLPRWRQFWLALIRKPLHEYFNETLSDRLFAAARLLP